MTAKSSLLSQMTWEIWNWMVQIGFYLVGLYYMYQAKALRIGHDSLLYYFTATTIVLGTATVNALILTHRPRGFIASVHIALNAYLIPFSYYSYGCGAVFAAWSSVIYVIITVAISPRLVGLVALISGICFALLQRAYYVGMGDSVYGDITKITFAYIALAALSYGWRLIAQKMYELFHQAYSNSPVAFGGGGGYDSERVEELERDNQLLKEEIAMHIIEIDKIVNNDKNKT